MKSITCVLLILMSLGVSASNVACILANGGEKSLAKIDFKEIDDEGYAYTYSQGAEFDLSFNMEFYCEANNCEVSIVVDSQILEDEAGSTGFEFKKTQAAGKIYSEPVTNAPDGKDYFLYCYLNK